MSCQCINAYHFGTLSWNSCCPIHYVEVKPSKFVLLCVISVYLSAVCSWISLPVHLGLCLDNERPSVCFAALFDRSSEHRWWFDKKNFLMSDNSCLWHLSQEPFQKPKRWRLKKFLDQHTEKYDIANFSTKTISIPRSLFPQPGQWTSDSIYCRMVDWELYLLLLQVML